MDAAFTVADRNQQFSTVFIKEDKWYSYRKYKLLQSGNTSQWFYLPKQRIDAVLIYANTSIDNLDFFLYDNKYSKYSFTILLKPIRIDEGRAAVVNSGYHHWFLHELHKDIGDEGTKALNLIISLKVDSETIVLFGTNEGRFPTRNAIIQRIR
jgi:hypothetical protein